MKKLFSLFFVALLGSAALFAQQISVVAPNGETTMYQTLDEAITSASDGSVVYLPGGGFSVSVTVDKRLTIIGVTHKVGADVADSNTIINGGLTFEEGSDGSAVMGAYVSGNINVGANNILIKYANFNSLVLLENQYTGTIVNQCYLRNMSDCKGAPVTVTNSIFHSWYNTSGSTFDHNVVTSNHLYQYGAYGDKLYRAFRDVSNSTISNNILLNPGANIHSGSNCQVYNNMISANWGSDCIQVASMDDILVDISQGVSPASDFHLKGEDGVGAASDGTDVGIYGGTGFSDGALPPVPHIVSKEVAEQTDASGKLKIKLTVKAN